MMVPRGGFQTVLQWGSKSTVAVYMERVCIDCVDITVTVVEIATGEIMVSTMLAQ
jgi:hypothetical protein